jgi:hypothetical protein
MLQLIFVIWYRKYISQTFRTSLLSEISLKTITVALARQFIRPVLPQNFELSLEFIRTLSPGPAARLSSLSNA